MVPVVQNDEIDIQEDVIDFTFTIYPKPPLEKNTLAEVI